MKLAAITKSRKRLELAHSQFQLCQSAKSFEEFADAWGKFLMSSAAVFNILEAGGIALPQGRQWYGEKRAAGKKDELLLYMRQARNEEEHGIEPVSRREIGGMLLEVNEGGMVIDTRKHKGDPTDIRELLTNPDVYVSGAGSIEFEWSAVLVPVTSYEGDVFHPPAKHMGLDIQDRSPSNVGRLYLAYIQRLIDEAAGYVPNPSR